MERTKNILTAMLFCGLLLFGALAAVLTPDIEISRTERRRLAQMPSVTVENVFSGKFFSDFEVYATEQFVPRDTLRTLKAAVSLGVFRKLDTHGIYFSEGSAVSMEYPLYENSVKGFTDKINSIADNLIRPEQRVFYSVIPDKNYYFAESAGRLRMDYEKMLKMLVEGFAQMEYIDLFGALGKDDYYKTDSHWSQERLYNVTGALAEGLLSAENPFPKEYKKRSFAPFYGVYYGQSALPMEADTITYLETQVTENAEVWHLESGKSEIVYDAAALSGSDAFDVFLSGATALCTVTNTQSPEGGELIIFRDSFAGSVTPLLLPLYSKITLIDLRYIAPALLPEYIDFEIQDVLFLYSTGMINQSGTLRGFAPINTAS